MWHPAGKECRAKRAYSELAQKELGTTFTPALAITARRFQLSADRQRFAGRVAGGGSEQAEPREQPQSENDRDDGHGDKNPEDRKDENHVASGWFRSRMSVTLQKREVPDVCLPSNIKQIANQWNEADEDVDDGVDQHSKLNDARNAHPHRVQQQQRREQRRRQIAEPGDEAENRIESERQARTGHAERAVEKNAPLPQRGQRAAMRLRQVLRCWHYSLLGEPGFAPRSGRRRYSLLALPHFSRCAWGPTPKRCRFARSRFASAEGSRSLSLGGFAPR